MLLKSSLWIPITEAALIVFGRLELSHGAFASIFPVGANEKGAGGVMLGEAGTSMSRGPLPVRGVGAGEYEYTVCKELFGWVWTCVIECFEFGCSA